MSPANALRTLKSAFTQLSRAIGQVFIPVLQSMLPWIQLAVKGLTYLAEKLAKFLGYTTQSFNTDSMDNMSSSISGIGDSAEDSAKKMKYFTTSFDELHTINNDTSDGAGLGGASILGDVELPEYDMLSKFAGNIVNDALPKLKEALEGFANSTGVQLVAGIIKSIYEKIKEFGDWAMENPEAFGELLGNLLTGLGAILALKGIGGFMLGVGNIIVALNHINTAVLDLFGSWKAFGLLLSKIIGVILIVISSIMLIGTAFKLITGKYESFSKTLRAGFVELGVLILGVGLAIGNGWLIAIGAMLTVTVGFWEEIVLATGKTLRAISIGIYNVFLKVQEWFANQLVEGQIFFEKLKLIVGEFVKSPENAVKALMLKIKKYFFDMINDILTNPVTKKVLGIIDKVTGSDLSEGIDKIVTGNLDAQIKKLENDMNKNSLTSGLAELDAKEERLKANIKTQNEDKLRNLDEWFKGRIDLWEYKVERKKENGAFEWGGITDIINTLNKSNETTQATEIATSNEEIIGLNQEQLDLQQQLNDIDVENLGDINATTDELASISGDTNNTLSDISNSPIMSSTASLDTINSKLDVIKSAIDDVSITVINNYGGGEYATGGLPSKGELFIANEAGPELVGSIGGRSAVANTTQMVEALAMGVYQGMMSANRNTPNKKIEVTVPVLLPNNKVLASATAQGQIENGYDIGLGGFDV